MKKFGYVIAALGAIAIAAPSIASAETTIIKRGGDHHYGARADKVVIKRGGDRQRLGARAEFREHRDFGRHEGWRRHGRADKTVIIKHGRDRD
jgi:hypothetical protein